jgi:serine/threonine protein kinase
MLDASGDRVMITDFGFAKNFWQSTPKTCLGTAAYVAPEVLELEPYDGTKVDAWACGMRKRYFLLRSFNVKTIILPRQARDKHRENSKKSTVLLQASSCMLC